MFIDVFLAMKIGPLKIPIKAADLLEFAMQAGK